MSKFFTKTTNDILTKDYRDDPLNVKPIRRMKSSFQATFNPTFVKPKIPKIKKAPKIQSYPGRSKPSKITLGDTLD